MKGELTKQRILEAAAEMIWRQSYHGVSVADIAGRAGVNKATLYQYFEAKDQLAVAVVRHHCQVTLDAVFHPAFRDHDDALDRLTAVFANVHRLQARIADDTGEVRGCPFVNLAMELAGSDEPVRREVLATFSQFRGYYARIALSVDPTRSDQHVQNIAAALIGVMNAGQVAAKLERRPGAILDALGVARQIAVMPADRVPSGAA